MKKVLVLLFSILFLFTFSNLAFALSATSLFSGSGENNFLEDDDVEWLVEDSSIGGDEDGNLDIGERLQGVYTVTGIGRNADSTTSIGAGTDYTGITGVFNIEVDTKEFIQERTVENVTFDTYDYTFKPVGSDTGAVLSVYEDPTPLGQFSGYTQSELITNVTDGTLLYEFGFDGDDDEIWQSLNTPEQTSIGTLFGQTFQLGDFQVRLSTITNNFLPVVPTKLGLGEDLTDGGDGFIDLVGSGQVLGSDGSDVYDVTSDSDFEFRTTPEPTTWFLLGTGLLVFAGLSRKKLMKNS